MGLGDWLVNVKPGDWLEKANHIMSVLAIKLKKILYTNPFILSKKDKKRPAWVGWEKVRLGD